MNSKAKVIDEADLKVDMHRLAGGGSSYVLTHIPTGLRVNDTSSSDQPVIVRWSRLKEKLAELLAEESP